MLKILMPYAAKAISSDALLKVRRSANEVKQRLRGETPTAHVFLKVDDPYSYLLTQGLELFTKRFDINIAYHTVRKLPGEMFPEQKMWNENSFRDAQRLADLYELDFPKDKPADDYSRLANATAQMLAVESTSNVLPRLTQILHDFWFNSDSEISEISEISENDSTQTVNHQLQKNEAKLNQLGHYNSAMVYFGGEWYWGLDRLDHLEHRLNELNLFRDSQQPIYFNRTYQSFCNTPSTQSEAKPVKPLTIFWSARSPYSYIGLERAVLLCRHYQIPCEVKPVLPMMMRGMAVPSTKKMYIFHDTKREAKKLGLPYGFVADPLGAGVERCYALFEFAKSQGKEVDFVLSFAREVNTNGVRADTQAGMKKIVTQANLNWETASHYLDNTDWLDWAQENLETLYGLGCWGVPCFQYGDITVWGQDRLVFIEQAFKEDRKMPPLR